MDVETHVDDGGGGAAGEQTAGVSSGAAADADGAGAGAATSGVSSELSGGGGGGDTGGGSGAEIMVVDGADAAAEAGEARTGGGRLHREDSRAESAKHVSFLFEALEVTVRDVPCCGVVCACVCCVMKQQGQEGRGWGRRTRLFQANPCEWRSFDGLFCLSGCLMVCFLLPCMRSI